MKNEFTPVSTEPPRQGFYIVKLASGDTCIAEWRMRDKKQGAVWWQHVSEDPTAEKVPVLLEGAAYWGRATKMDIEKALKREPTEAERIQDAVEAYYSNAKLYSILDTPVPERRRLKLGERVELGALKDCRVVDLREEGRVVVVSYHDKRLVYGKEVDKGRAYQARHWTGLVSKERCQETSLVSESKLNNSYSSTTLDSLMRRYLLGLSDSPDYQRGYVWTMTDKQRLLESLFSGRDIGRFIFVKQPYPQVDEILDGKQRLHCLWEFYTSQIPYNGVYWHELSTRDRNDIECRSVQYADLESTRYSRADLLHIFLELNAAGVPQTQEHLDKVRDLLNEELAKEK